MKRYNIHIADVTADQEDITLAAAKSFLQLDDYDEEDDLISELIAASREYCEGFTKRLFIKREVVEYRDDYTDVYPIQQSIRSQSMQTYYPIAELTSIEYYIDDAKEAVSSSVYDSDLHGGTTVIMLNPGQSWPVADQGPGKVILTYDSGYDETPKKGIIAQKKLIRTWYDERYDGIRRHPSLVDNLLHSLIRYH